jgi:sortase A
MSAALLRRAALLRGRGAFVSNLLLVAGALLLVRPAYDHFVGMRAQSRPASAAVSRLSLSTRARPPVRARSEGEALGRLEIPRIGMDLEVFEGQSDATLRRGPGHLPGTSWPSEGSPPGNCVIAGHRDSFFRPLEKVRENDVVRLRSESGVATYRLERRRVVRPRDVSALRPTGDSRLTLVTCYPFRWWHQAPLRLVWTAVPAENGPAEASMRSAPPAAR